MPRATDTRAWPGASMVYDGMHMPWVLANQHSSPHTCMHLCECACMQHAYMHSVHVYMHAHHMYSCLHVFMHACMYCMHVSV